MASPALCSTDEFVGDVRVQVLAPSLVRLEQKGPRGFEDRPTFHTVERNWPGASVKRSQDGNAVTLAAAGFKIRIPAKATGIKGIRIEDAEGKTLYACSGDESNSVWLPAPGDVPAAWAFADKPRLVPPAWGAIPAPSERSAGQTNGWDVANDAPDVYVFLPGGDYRRLRSDFLRLTGPTPMPPLFALGLIDSRYYAYTEQTALEQIDTYRRKQIPLDVMVIDTDWRIGASTGYKPDPKCFPDMPRFLREAHARNVHVMFNDHPEPKGKSALERTELQYRFDGLSALMREGVDVWWYDRNWSVSLLEPAPGLRHEAWGMMLYHDIAQSVFPQRRPLIMANVDGIDNGIRNSPPNVAAHRYPMQWTGDTAAQWEFVRHGVENAVQGGVCGLNAWMSEDLSGHVGRPTDDLYVRFVQYGCLSPITRLHCTKGQVRHPWAFSPQAERIVTDYVKLRYRLLPLLYAAARETFETGEPIVRRLDLDYPAYKEAARNDQYLLGHGLLIAPIVDGEHYEKLPGSLLSTPEGKPGIKAEYFANAKLEGAAGVSRVEEKLDFSWGDRSPAKDIPSDNFSCRWTGKLGPIPDGPPMKLGVTADDGVRVWLDEKLVIDHWEPQDSVTNFAAAALVPGKSYQLRVEHYEGTGNAMCRLVWMAMHPKMPDRRDVWIPPGEWTDLWTGTARRGPQTIEVEPSLDRVSMFIRSGTIIPLAPEMQYTGQRPWDPVTLEVYPSVTTEAQITLYEDDGISNQYLKTDFRKTPLHCAADVGRRIINVSIGEPIGHCDAAPQSRAWIVRVHPPHDWLAEFKIKAVRIDGFAVNGWRVLPRATQECMPFSGGQAMDGAVVEVNLPSRSARSGQVIEVEFGR